MPSLPDLCLSGKLDEVRAALARGVDVNEKEPPLQETGLMMAVRHNKHSIARLLLEQPTLDLNATDLMERTALHYAAWGGNVEGVRLLLTDPRLNISNANKKDKFGKTPVMVAMQRNRINVLRELVAHPMIELDTSLEDVAK